MKFTISGTMASMRLSVKNISDEPLVAWKLSFDGNFEIVSLWNGTLLHTSDGSFAV